MRAQLFIVLFAVLAVAYAGDFSSAKYQAQTAQQKMTQLWKEIKSDTTPYGWYSALSFAGLFFENMKTSFDTYSDVLPEGRKKLIHSVGSVAQFEFVPKSGSPYTGVFEGVSNGLIRISTAKQANPKKEAKGNFLPGMGIKLLRDGVPSANLVAMLSVEGQDSWNIFQYDWSHHVANPCSFALKIASKKFEQATPYVGRIGIKTWAQYDEKGREVEASKMKVPFKLYFRPGKAIKSKFPETYQDEFTKQLSTIPVGTIIYDVYAVPKPHEDAVKVGSFKTKSLFWTSKFGDKDLFFQHNYEEEDLAVHPEWKKDIEVNPPVWSKIVE
jgi:hypothetical protein